MQEERFEIIPYGVRYLCDCGGEMNPIWTKANIVDGEPEFLHICKCGETVDLKEKYPTVRWERK